MLRNRNDIYRGKTREFERVSVENKGLKKNIWKCLGENAEACSPWSVKLKIQIERNSLKGVILSNKLRTLLYVPQKLLHRDSRLIGVSGNLPHVTCTRQEVKDRIAQCGAHHLKTRSLGHVLSNNGEFLPFQRNYNSTQSICYRYYRIETSAFKVSGPVLHIRTICAAL